MTERTKQADSFLLRRLRSRLFDARRLTSSHQKHTQPTHKWPLGASSNLIKMIFYGTSVAFAVLLIMLLVSYGVYGNTYVLPRILLFIPFLFYLGLILFFINRRSFSTAAWLLITLYALIAAILLWTWSINAQIGILALGFVIVLAGTTLRAKYILHVTVGIVVLLALLQAAYELGIVNPNTQSLEKSSTYGDVMTYGVIFGIFALIAWLSRRQMEQALQRALDAEEALVKEKSLLAVRLAKQTRHLREVQLQEMQQLYRFAELGQLSTALLHELANHLTVLTLDIDDLGRRHQQSEAVANAKQSIEYLDAMVNQVRRQLHDNNEFEEFSVIECAQEVAQTLQPKATKAGIALIVSRHGTTHNPHAFGDPLRFSQIITVLVTNAIEAYMTMDKLPDYPVVEIDVTANKKTVSVAIIDHAGGISDFHRSQLFTPFKSNKQTGMGIGLYIARHMAETHFKGKLLLDDRTDQTRFVLEIPTYHSKRS